MDNRHYLDFVGIATDSDKLDGQQGSHYLDYSNFVGIATDSDKLDGQQGSHYLDYSNFVGVATDADKLDGQQGSHYLDYSNFVGIATDSDKLDGQQGSHYLDYSNFSGTASELNVSGITTLGTVKISSGIITATSGVVTYYGDGSQLTGISAGGSSSVWETNSAGINTTSNVGIGTTNPLAKLDVRDGSVYVPGGTFDASSLGGGNDSKTDAALVIDRSSAIYFQSGGYLRNLIEPADTVINIGQQNTALISEINLKPGNASTNGVKLHHGGTTDNVKLQTTGTGVSVTGTVSATTFSGSGASLINIPTSALVGLATDA